MAMSSIACPIQAALLKERVILVNRSDDIIGSDTKENVHLMKNIERTGMLHRAFSVFLFNSKNELLMQRRSPEKITFPNLYTNTCCSHPLYTIPQELNSMEGVKLAAIRRMKDELGIVDVQVEDVTFMTRIIYYCASSGLWGEHELDHVLMVKKDVNIVPNPNEVSEVRYFSKNELYETLAAKDGRFPVTPWFDIIAGSFLKQWWDNVDQLHSQADTKIHEFSFPKTAEE